MGLKVGLGMEQGLSLTARAGLWGLSKSCHPSRKEFTLTWPTGSFFPSHCEGLCRDQPSRGCPSTWQLSHALNGVLDPGPHKGFFSGNKTKQKCSKAQVSCKHFKRQCSCPSASSSLPTSFPGPVGGRGCCQGSVSSGACAPDSHCSGLEGH